MSDAGPETGGTHGPRQDDALERETRSEVQANRATRLEEWREPEPPGEDEPDATQILAGRAEPEPGIAPEVLELRSDIARHLDRTAFPADRSHLLATLASHQASDGIIRLVAALPDGERWERPAEVFRALGLPVESREGG